MSSFLKRIAGTVGHAIRRTSRPVSEEGNRDAAGLTSIATIEPNDIVIAGYPKSGNTWFQNLVAGVAFGVRPELAPDTLVQELVPDVHFKTYYRRLRSPMFFKSHNLPRPDYRRVVYLLRDGRDVMVSYYHHRRALDGPDVDFSQLVQTGRDLFPCKWHEHVEAWLTNPYDAEMITIRYEDLQADAKGEMLRLCEFASLNCPEAVLGDVVQGARFESLRRKEIQDGPVNPRWPRDNPFVRRGKIGSHVDEMPPDVLASFMSEAEPVLRRCGYTVLHDDQQETECSR